MVGMLHYTIYIDKPESTYEESFNNFIQNNQSLKDEVIELIEYLLKHQKQLTKSIKLDCRLPLDLYADYHLDQILAAFDVNKETQKYSLRQGVHFISEKITDIFFITINKNEGDYLESTRYNDYAISDTLFHSESQSITTDTSTTCKRYINNQSDHKVLLFVSEAKKQYKKTLMFQMKNSQSLKYQIME